ncbi:MAG: hypothetical protein CMC27_01790 [Flavobacteriaceae bacterium]|nr:hypothetical protein [Flavobacteriaceae bacterium]|tara:strand:+ start:1277 stop:1858 length:582 start_codon:yes stop_codon:yes gene_type:complete
MISNRDLVEKTKPVLKDSYLQVFACLLLALLLPQIVLSLSPTNVLLNIVIVCVTAYIQVGVALYSLEIYKGKKVGLETIFSRFNGFKPIIFTLIYTLIVFLGLILLVVPGIILGLMYSQVFYILADNPDIGVTEAFNMSSKMMKNNMLQLFMLNLEALLYFIAGIFTLLIWWVWLVPRYYVAYAGFYEAIKNE